MPHYDLTEAMKRRFIGELREFWSKDPKYKDTLAGNIQGKFSFDERPQQFIVLKGQSATPIRFSADNFQGFVLSHCYLTRIYGHQGTSIEWVEEDGRQIQKNGGEFPSPPGIYYVEVLREDYEWQGVLEPYLVFYVDPLLQVIDGRPVQIDPTTYDIAQGSFHPESLVLYEMPGQLPLYEGINYEADPTTGRITLTQPLPSGTYLSADYFYTGTTVGPFPVPENGANNEAIPGATIVFGRKAFDGDVMAVVVGDRREEVAREYGGRFEMSIELDIMARDVNAAGEIADRTFFYMQAELRDRLSFEGVEIDQVSLGADTEEVYDNVGDDYFYGASISLTVMTDWSIRKPLGRTLTRVLPGTLVEDQVAAGLSNDQLVATGFTSGVRAAAQLGLVSIQDPYFRDRTQDYEMIR